MNTEETINYLTNLKNNLTDSVESLYSTCDLLTSVLSRNIQPNSIYPVVINEVRDRVNLYAIAGNEGLQALGAASLDSLKVRLSLMIDTIIIEVSHIGLPDSSKQASSNNISITNNNSQSQSQTIDIAVLLESLKAELSKDQLDEIKGVFKWEKDPVKAKSQLIEKLKSFGENTASNVVAGLLTNPSIWSLLSA